MTTPKQYSSFDQYPQKYRYSKFKTPKNTPLNPVCIYAKSTPWGLQAIKNDLELPEEKAHNSNLFYTALALRSAVWEVVGLDITSKITSEDICAENMK